MNSIGVDFKLKNLELDGKNIKLQIVFIEIINYQVGHSWSRKVQNYYNKLL